MSKKATIKSVGDIEREKQLGRNKFNSNKEYTEELAFGKGDGHVNDNAERIKQMGRSEYNSNNEYNDTKLDL